MTDSSSDHSAMVDVIERKGISAVWLVPFIALIFGGWLLVKAIAERGVFITVEFDNATGVVIGKTEVKYRGLTVGVVRGIEVSEDLQSVIVDIEMISESDEYLTENTKFWYVTADVSISGVKGLDTLLSGSYINMMPDFTKQGESQSHFVALEDEPTLDVHVDGLHVVLTAKSLGSVAKDSPVLFKQIQVGYVAGHSYDEQQDLVKINVFIKPDYAHLVKENSRFWNASGFTVSGSLTSGVQIQTQSLATIVSGGIAFDNSSHETGGELAQNGRVYPLHSNFQAAEMGHNIILDLEWGADVDIGAPIVYQGITLGRVESFTDINPETHKIQALAKINPRVERYLTTESQFYLQSPEIDLGGVTNIHRMLTGSQIGIRPSVAGEPTDRFKVYSNKPAYKYTEPGLHLILETESVTSLHTGIGVYFQQQQVGSVQAIENNGPNRFLIHIFIEPQYQDYVSTDSRFWQASGLRITGGLQGFEVQAQSAQAILKGGIAFDKGVSDKPIKPSNGDSYKLYEHQSIAEQRLALTLVMQRANAVKIGTRIIYRGETIGSIHNIELRDGKAYLSAGLTPMFAHLLKETSQFWLVEPKLSLAGLTDTDALFNGAYFAVNAGAGEPQHQFVASLSPPAKHSSSDGLQLTIKSENAVSINAGSPVNYRGIVVGQIDNVALESNGEYVTIHITIDQPYRQLVKETSRFYNASGINVSGGLNGLTLQTSSMDTLLTGGISFITPEATINSKGVNEGSQFNLFNTEAQAKNAGLSISIYFAELSGIKEGLAIKYRDHQIGKIERLVFDKEKHGVTALALLNDYGAQFAVAGTKFWYAEPQLGLVANKHLGDMLAGGFIGVVAGDGQPSQAFRAESMPPAIQQLPYGLNLKLVADKLGSIRAGDPVLYRQVPVGEVIGVDLANAANKVNIYINIADKYASLVTAESVFWNTSGFNIDAGLLSGLQIESESIETILSGGVAFATPENASEMPIEQGYGFVLHDEVKDEWQQWSPEIKLVD